MDRQLLAMNLYETGAGTHKYDVKYTGEWKDLELVNAVDNRCTKKNPTKEDLYCSNFGGVVYKVHSSDENVSRALVYVYYD